MSVKRRDKKNRILRNGESQRSDGRYAYKYTDANGKVHFVYSWKLEKTDKLPAGKRDDISLREKIKEIERDLLDGIAPNGGDMSVLQLVEKYVLTRTDVSHNTEAGYRTVINVLKKDSFGLLRIDKVKLQDAKEWLVRLKESGRKYSSIQSIRGVVRPAFQMAYENDIIRKNPFDFQLATLIVNDSVIREAITRKQERLFLEYVRQDKHFSTYYDGMFILFKTGLRISEFVGLTVADIDMKERKISVNHQLQRTRKMDYIITPTKTGAGTRDLPMTDEVYECFSRIVANRKPPKAEPMIQGKTGFLFFDKNGKPMVALHWEKYFQRALEKYNNIYKIPLPKITPHICRHTYCTNMARSGMNPKTLQYLMGHSEIAITYDTYTHFGFDEAKNELSKVKEEKLG